MSMQTLERVILAGAKDLFKNSKLKMKDIQEWSTGEIKPPEGEVVAYMSDPGVFVAIKKVDDKRGEAHA